MKCGNCRYCVATGQDMGAPHQCFVNPPVVHFVPVPHPMDQKQVGLQQITARPMVNITDPGCSMFYKEM